ncbi:hypothetical protein [uncultured Sphingomonas sp.]|uniref:hypothetical protein n=1 Tax=uncultured Sphingomonas sp. TaxID=158754 RepID=UPI0025EDA285|nr:hypothetical protein [uncultured Sphingomonas sp.]
MSDDHPFGDARRSRMGPAVLIAALVLAIGLGLMIFAIRDEPGWLRRGSDAGTAARTATQPAQQTPTAAAVDTDTLSQRETALAAQIASLEARAATLGSSTANAEGRAGRAEAILIAFAARRAIDRGLGLGYLEEQIRARFAGATREASAVIRASRNPVTLESLRQDLDTAAPVLLARESSWWGGLGAELRNLIVIHEAGTPSPLPADRLARVRRLVDAGRVEEALVEVKRLPGAANAASWTSAAQRYVDAHRALDQLETIAIVGPVAPPAAASGQVIQSPALPIQPQPVPTADLGNYL